MRFKNSYAAAVAAAVSAVVFSAAFQPAEAALITIDNFTQATGTNSVSGTSTTEFVTDSVSITGPFDTRDRAIGDNIDNPPRPFRTYSTSVGSGVGTLSYAISGTTSGQDVYLDGSFVYTNTGGDVDLLALTAGGSPGFFIETGPNTTLPAIAQSYLSVQSEGGAQTGLVYLPGNWAPNQTYYIPFSSIVADFDPINFAAVSFVSVGFLVEPASGTVSSSGQVEFTLVAVPEPTHMVSVAGVGAALGAWRLRKLRRSRPATRSRADRE
jgi:hypothetical protein